jgi:hypothetical protein
LIPYDGSIDVYAFDEKTSGTPIAEKVDGEILSVTMKFVTGIRQEKIPDFVFVHPVRNVALKYRPVDPGCLESQQQLVAHHLIRLAEQLANQVS